MNPNDHMDKTINCVGCMTDATTSQCGHVVTPAGERVVASWCDKCWRANEARFQAYAGEWREEMGRTTFEVG